MKFILIRRNFIFKKIARNLKAYLKILNKYLSAEISYNFLNKDDIESGEFPERSQQGKEHADNDSPLSILSIFEEEIMHLSIDKFYIKCENLDLIAEKEDIKRKFISFEINKLKLNINTEKLGKVYAQDKPAKTLPINHNKIFHILDISLLFSNITKCIFKSISIELRKDSNKKETLFDFTVEKMEIMALKDKKPDFFLCPYSNKKHKKVDFLKDKKKAAFSMEFKVFDSKIKSTSVNLLPVSIYLSTQKTNAILQNLNVLMEMNNHEYKLYKQYLKSEVLQEGYKDIIKRAKFVYPEVEHKNVTPVFDTMTSLKNERNELPKITVDFKKIFLILSKGEEVFPF